MRSLLVPALLLSATAHADGRIVEVTRKVPEFTGVQVGSGIRAIVETGPYAPITLRGDEKQLEKIRTEVEDGVLRIGVDPNTRLGNGEVKVTVRLPRATSLGASGGSLMEASVPAGDSFAVSASGGSQVRVTSKVTTKRFDLSASGGSQATLAGVDADQMEISLSGASRGAFVGRAQSASASLSGAAELDGATVQVERLAVEATGGSRVQMRVTRQVSGSLGGGSRVRVARSADVKVEVSGGSSVTRDL